MMAFDIKRALGLAKRDKLFFLKCLGVKIEPWQAKIIREVK